MYEPHRPQSNFDDIGEFHYKFGLSSVTHESKGAQPREVPTDLLTFRMVFLLEELREIMSAAGYKLVGDEWGNISLVVPEENTDRDHGEIFDGLLDLVVVAMGTAHLFGYPWQQGWELVQRANMSKVKAQADGSDSKRGSSYDIVKPEGWTAPDIAGLLRGYGWDA